MSISENWYITKKYYKKNLMYHAKMDRAVIRFKTFYFTLRAVLVSVDCSLLHVWASSVSKHFSDDLLAQHFPIYQLFWTAQIRVKEMKQRQHHNHPLDFCSWFSVRFCIVKSSTQVFVLVIESLDRSSSRYYEAQIHAACCFIEMETWSV